MTEEVPEHEEVETESPENSRFDDELRGHAYDGIHEYDNPSPQWFNALFIGSIVWAVLYSLGMWFDYMPGWHETHENSMEKLQEKRIAAKAKEKSISTSTLEAAVENDGKISTGKEVFASNCSRCHGDAGGGEIGPNLTDDYWLHGGSLKSIFATVKEGVTDKGMPAWDAQLSRDEMVAVTAYIRSIRGTEPPDAKDPEGDEWRPDGGG